MPRPLQPEGSSVFIKFNKKLKTQKNPDKIKRTLV